MPGGIRGAQVEPGTEEPSQGIGEAKETRRPAEELSDSDRQQIVDRAMNRCAWSFAFRTFQQVLSFDPRTAYLYPATRLREAGGAYDPDAVFRRLLQAASKSASTTEEQDAYRYHQTRQFNWQHAKQNFCDCHTEYNPPKHRFSSLYLRQTVSSGFKVFEGSARCARNGDAMVAETSG